MYEFFFIFIKTILTAVNYVDYVLEANNNVHVFYIPKNMNSGYITQEPYSVINNYTRYLSTPKIYKTFSTPIYLTFKRLNTSENSLMDQIFMIDTGQWVTHIRHDDGICVEYEPISRNLILNNCTNHPNQRFIKVDNSINFSKNHYSNMKMVEDDKFRQINPILDRILEQNID